MHKTTEVIALPASTIHVTDCQAPCGRQVDDDRAENSDGFGLIVRVDHYACGCRHIYHEYHDGSVSERTVRHDGRELASPLRSEQRG